MVQSFSCFCPDTFLPFSEQNVHR
uniref:Uncharacterized protein n=1 Tax=Anguilla anguilla TaxID=7936 RepID=A0A0E9RQX3_ANGAN